MPQLKEKPVVKRRYIEGHDMTLEEIGEYFGVHRNSVHSMELRAMKKFKLEIERRGYTMKDFFR